MILRYTLPDGEKKEFHLSGKTIAIGRGTDADLMIADKQASRVHCRITRQDGDYMLRDCDSRNGTFVNDLPVKVCRINAGDRIRIGKTVLAMEAVRRPGTVTVLRELKDEMAKGKGYHTILQEIIRDEEGISDQ